MKAKKRGRCKCLALNRWRCGDFCSCWHNEEPTPPVPPVPIDYAALAIDRFTNSVVFENAVDKDTAITKAAWIALSAWSDALEPFYHAWENWQTFEAYVTEQWLTVDETWPCDDVLVANDDVFTLYVSTMSSLIECKYLAVDWGGNLINATEIDAYLATIQ